ncbi:unnamed protein product, partial [Cladocopium goreaui]
MQPGESIVPVLHVCVMGAPQSGKTCLINSWVNNIAPSVYVKTTEPTSYYKSMLLPNALHDGEAITTLVEVEEAAWPEDKEGCEVDAVDYAKKFQEAEARSDGVMASYTHPMTDFTPEAPVRLARSRMSFIVLFDITSKESTDKALQIIEEMRSNKKSGFKSGMKVRLVANKVDLEATADQEVVEDNRTTAERQCWDTVGMDFREVSAVEFRGVRDLFQDLLEETMEMTEQWATSAMKRQTEPNVVELTGAVQERKKILKGRLTLAMHNAEELAVQGGKNEPESDDVKQRNDEAIHELNLVPTVHILQAVENQKQETFEKKEPDRVPSDKLAPAKIDRVESNTSIVTDNEEVKCQRRDYFLQMTRDRVTSALGTIIENPSDIQAFYTLKDKLGAGQFGTVSTGVITANGVERAVKLIAKKDNYSALKALKAEIEIMKMLDHPNLVAITEIFEDTDAVYLAMKLCKGSHLTLYVDRVASLSEKQAAFVMRDLFRAVAYMHNSGVAHRDLKGENCLMLTQAPPERNRLKLCDFGLSTTFEPGKPLRGRVGSVTHIAPEVLTSSESYTCAIDNWSAGIIFYHVICGFLPFQEEKDVLNGRLSFADRHW